MVVKCDAAEEGALLVRDTRLRWFPDVRATANGAPAEVLRANGPYLAVRVPAGPCEVVLEPVVPWGRYALPALGWIVSLGLLAFWSRRAFAPIAPSPVSSGAA